MSTGQMSIESMTTEAIVEATQLPSIFEVSLKKRVAGLAAICLLLLALLLGIGAFYNLKIRYDLARERVAEAAPRTEVVLYGTRDMLLNNPRDVAIARDGSIFVADSGNGHIAVFDELGTLKYVFGAEGEIKGVRTKISKPSLINPVSISISKKGEIAVADSARDELLIFDADGELLREEAFRGESVSHVAYGPDEQDDEVLYIVTSSGIARTDERGKVALFMPFSKGADGRAEQVISGIAVALSKDGKPIVCLTDASAGTLITIDNFATGLRIIGEMDGAFIPNGVAAVTVRGSDPTIWVSEAGAPAILEVTDSDTRPIKGISTYGTGEGALLAPAGIDANSSRIAVADPQANRVTVYSATGSGPALGKRIDGYSFALLVAISLAFLGALAAAFLYFSTRVRRFTFDASALERADLEGIIDDIDGRFERHVPEVVVAQNVQEFAYRAVRSVPIETPAVSHRHIEAIQLRYAYLDDLDAASVALAEQLKHTHTLVTDNMRIVEIAKELHIEVLTYEEFVALTADSEPDSEVEPEPAAWPELEADEGFVKLSAILAVIILVLALSFALPLVASAAASRTITNLSDIKSLDPLVTSTSSPDSSDPAIGEAPPADKHAVLKTACTSCHGSTRTSSKHLSATVRASSIDQTSRLCATCHASASLAGAGQPYQATGGDIEHFSAAQSGHRMGLAQQVPASKTEGMVSLSCGSCHAVHSASVKACSSCHDQAVFDQDSGTSLGIARTFDLNVETRAHGEQKKGPLLKGHPSPLQTDYKSTEGRAKNRAKSGVSVAEDGCYECHRGDLVTDDSCNGCHYSREDFESDANRKARTSGWPHVSNSFILLGKNSIPAASQNPTQEQIRTEACTRCHPVAKGASRALSPHAVLHDATLSTPGTQIKGPSVDSIETTSSPGYVRTGRFSASQLTMIVPEEGESITTYMDVKCTQCHNTSVQAEHALRTEKSCASCHTITDDQGRPDYSKVGDGMNAEAFATCGTANSACHSDNWHGFDAKRVKSAHELRKPDPSDTLQLNAGCAQERNGVPSCHARGSSQSLFFFGSMDLASAHNDYWSAQNETHSTNQKYDKKTVKLEQTRGCGLCHSATSERPKGAKASAKAQASGGVFNCATCHNVALETYAEENCLRATPKKKPIKAPADSSELDIKALEYLRLLGLQQEGSGESGQSTGGNASSSLKPGVSSTKASKIPPEFIPLTGGLPLDSELSILGYFFSPYPSLMKPNNFVNTLQNIK